MKTPQQILQEVPEELEKKFVDLTKAIDVCPVDGENQGYNKAHYCIKHDTGTIIIPSVGKEVLSFLTFTLQSFIEAEIERLGEMKRNTRHMEDYIDEEKMDYVQGYNQALQDQISHLKELKI